MAPVSRDQSATLRQLKLLVLVLVLSNLALGGFSFYLLRNIDRNYSELISGSVPLLNDLQALTAQAVDAMRETNTNLFNAPVSDRPLAVQRSELAFASDRRLRAAVLNRPWHSSIDSALAQLKTTGESFTKAGTDLLRLHAAGRIDEATQLRDQVLRPAFAKYLEAATNAADIVEAESLKASAAITARAGSASKILLGVASWPIALLAGLLGLTAIFVIVLMVLFRGREMSDMP